MGRFSVALDVANNEDIVQARHGYLREDQVRRLEIRGVVDSGAAGLVLPESVVRQLGLPTKGKVRVRYADGRRTLRKEVEAVRVYLQGRDSVFNAVVEPKRDTALIGAIVLEELDFLIDNKKQVLVPRDPEFKFSEIE